MITNYKLDKSFGAAGSVAGICVFIAGLVMIWSYLSGIVLVAIGAFTGFSYSSTFIDYARKRVKFSNNIFGFIRIGKWVEIDPSMKIGIRESNQKYSTSSRGGRMLQVTEHDFRIILIDQRNQEIMPLQKKGSLSEARTFAETECGRLGLALSQVSLT